MDEKLFQIILALIPILGAIITGFIIPFIKEKISAEKLSKYEYWANLAVKAAEMLWTESGCGKDKKQYVVNFLNVILLTSTYDVFPKLKDICNKKHNWVMAGMISLLPCIIWLLNLIIIISFIFGYAAYTPIYAHVANVKTNGSTMPTGKNPMKMNTLNAITRSIPKIAGMFLLSPINTNISPFLNIL